MVAEDTTVRGKSGWVRMIIVPVSLSLTTFLGGYIWNHVHTVTDLKSKVEKLEEDRSKWGALTEILNKQAELDTRIKLAENNVEWLRWALQSGKTIEVPKPAPSTAKPEMPPPPELQLEQRPIDPLDYKRIYEQKYPVQKK